MSFTLNVTVQVPEGIKKDTSAFDDLMAEIGATAERQVAERFAGSHGPDGAAWAATKRGGQILVDTGALRGSIASSVGDDSVEIGAGAFYGLFHQEGTSKMVARPFLGFGDADWREIEEIVERALQNLVGGGS